MKRIIMLIDGTWNEEGKGNEHQHCEARPKLSKR